MPITRILVPVDFSAYADSALQYALELARPFHANIHLVHVVENPLAAGVWSAEMYTADIAGLQINLVRDAEARVRSYVPDNAGTVTTEVRTGKAATQILEAAHEWGADLIVMGTHGRSGIAHLLMGSVAEKVVRLATCPVLTVRASEPSAETANVA